MLRLDLAGARCERSEQWQKCNEQNEIAFHHRHILKLIKKDKLFCALAAQEFEDLRQRPRAVAERVFHGISQFCKRLSVPAGDE